MADSRNAMSGGYGIYADRNRNIRQDSYLIQNDLPEFPLRHEKNNVPVNNSVSYNQNENIHGDIKHNSPQYQFNGQQNFKRYPSPPKRENPPPVHEARSEEFHNNNENQNFKKTGIGSLFDGILGNGGVGSILSLHDKNGALDTEKLMLAAFIFMLMKEGADKKLAIALAYIML